MEAQKNFLQRIITGITKPFAWCLDRAKGFWRWLTSRKDEIVTEEDLYFFHTKRILVVFILFVLLCGFSIVAFISLWKDGEGMSAVPDVTGQTLTAALLELQDKNLYGIVKTISDISRPTGIVLDQEPKGGFFTRENRSVMLFLNQPALDNEVPNIIGKTLTEARQLLTRHASGKYETALGIIAYGQSEIIPPGCIAAQNPAPAQPAPNPLIVNVVVSLGKPHSAVELPDFRGQNFDSAARWLAINNITAAAQQSKGGTPGVIGAQDPAPGTRIHEGAAVTLSVGGSEKYGVIDFIFPLMLKLSQASLNFTAAQINTADQDLSVDQLKLRQQRDEERLQRELIREGDASYPVEISLASENGNRALLYKGTHKPGERLVQSFSYDTEVTLELHIDGRKFISRKYQ
ncbi:MAG: PASTA domain-containing protein [Spirochaetota bacterium]|jgi:beta-lactam-binding protein with PASTA domain|nr:PASTA domain-containing protein [Spirochaetota bacterium]